MRERGPLARFSRLRRMPGDDPLAGCRPTVLPKGVEPLPLASLCSGSHRWFASKRCLMARSLLRCGELGLLHIAGLYSCYAGSSWREDFAALITVSRSTALSGWRCGAV